MQEVFSKIIEKLEEENSRLKRLRNNCIALSDSEVSAIENKAYNFSIEIVKQEAEKFGTDTDVGSNGWIPCNERLPEGRQDVLVCFDNIDGCIIAWYAPNGRTWRNSSTDNICKAEPIAWMNLPSPYQPKGE